MFKEMERTYRTAQEEELTSNVKILRIILILLIISSSALLVYFVLYLIYEYSPYYGFFYYGEEVRHVFSNIFYGLAIGIQYPTILVLAIIMIKVTKNLLQEIRTKFYVIAFLILGLVVINLLFTLVAGIFYVFINPASEAAAKFGTVSFTFSFYTDYLIIAIAAILISVILVEMKDKKIYSGRLTITPFIQGGFFAIWMLCVLAYRTTGGMLLDKLILTINLFACFFALSKIATYIEFLVMLNQIDVPQIIAMTEKLP